MSNRIAVRMPLYRPGKSRYCFGSSRRTVPASKSRARSSFSRFGGVVFVSQTEIDRQIRTDAPLVLDVADIEFLLADMNAEIANVGYRRAGIAKKVIQVRIGVRETSKLVQGTRMARISPPALI